MNSKLAALLALMLGLTVLLAVFSGVHALAGTTTSIPRNLRPDTTPPVANFSASPLTGTAPLTVAFTNQSTGSYDSVVWNFGDGVTSTVTNPTHTYAIGTYTVTLQVIGVDGTDILTRPHYIEAVMPADIVIVIDTSDMQAYDAPSGYAYAVANGLPGDPS
jgi:PKD repeat protein